jgi:hypothetical protein
MKIFVSYTTRNREITLDFLYNLDEALKEIGNPFIDLLHNKSTQRQSRVMRELETSDLLLLIDCAEVDDSGWVRIEIDRALQLNIPIIKMPLNDLLKTKNNTINII